MLTLNEPTEQDYWAECRQLRGNLFACQTDAARNLVDEYEEIIREEIAYTKQDLLTVTENLCQKYELYAEENKFELYCLLVASVQIYDKHLGFRKIG